MMKKALIIPAYFGKPPGSKSASEDPGFVLSIPKDETGPFPDLLESIENIDRSETKIIIVGVSADPNITGQIENRIRAILRQYGPKKTRYFSYSHLKNLKEIYYIDNSRGKDDCFLTLDSEPAAHNIGLMLAHILECQAAVFIDTQKVIKSLDYMENAGYKLGDKTGSFPVLAKTGPVVDHNGNTRVAPPLDMAYHHIIWNKSRIVNYAYDRFLKPAARLTEVPFVFEGNIAIHRDLFLKVPFDPICKTGPGQDYLINALLFGYRFFVDGNMILTKNEKTKKAPEWLELRRDILRFVHMKKKLDSSMRHGLFRTLTPVDLEPYPGAFLGDDLHEKAMKTNVALYRYYQEKMMIGDGIETIANIRMTSEKFHEDVDPVTDLIVKTRKWHSLTGWIDDNRRDLAKIIEII